MVIGYELQLVTNWD